ncbi:hypothetical protein KBD18_00890 [Patescibacteria group bacterium]|nr:hypothetical protein [Patescibacteria group bacterium]
MDVHIPAPLRDHPRNLIRRAGYAEFRDPNTGETSYVRRLQSGVFYPRFHVYLKDRQEGVVISLHLDQKKPSYGQGHAHSGEYEGATVVQEMDRIRTTIAALPEAADEETEEKSGGFFSRLFGG